MAEQLKTTKRCDSCGNVYAADTLVCPKCHTILAAPVSRTRRRTPGWFIALLILLIIALAAYAVYLAWTQLVLHNYY